MFKYKVFDLVLCSEIELCELISTDHEPDVYLSIEQTPETIPNILFSNQRLKLNSSQFLLKRENLANYYVKNGNKIIIDPAKGASMDEVKIFLYGSVFNALLYQRNYFQLHAGVVKIGKKAILLLGQSGSGKSTLSATMHFLGKQVLSDDIAVIKFKKDDVIVFPAIPRIKLNENVLEQFGQDVNQFDKVRKSNNKKAFLIKDNFYDKPLTVAAIYSITVKETCSQCIVPLSGIDVFSKLRNNTHRYKHVKGMDMQKWHFKNCMHIANQILVKEVFRQPGSDPNEVCRLILNDFIKA